MAEKTFFTHSHTKLMNHSVLSSTHEVCVQTLSCHLCNMTYVENI